MRLLSGAWEVGLLSARVVRWTKPNLNAAAARSARCAALDSIFSLQYLFHYLDQNN
jgi:hypothetical protein